MKKWIIKKRKKKWRNEFNIWYTRSNLERALGYANHLEDELVTFSY